jgi:DNA primase
MFPIRDTEGRIVSFGARALGPNDQPKYLNGPQTPIFDKSTVLFGLHAGMQAIRKERRAIVVEGYMDVVVPHQAGFQNVVATLGTSITERHLKQLARLAPEICLALDPDAAGQNAVMRSAEVGRAALSDAAVPIPTWRGLVRYQAGSRASITVAVLPDGKDPDELVLEDPERWKAAIGAARPLIDHAIESVATRHDVSTAAGKAEAADELVPLLIDVADPIQRAHYVELAAQYIHVDAQALAARTRTAPKTQRTAAPMRSRNAPAPRPVRPQLDPGPEPRHREQHYAIALIVASAHRGQPIVEIDPDDFTDPAARALMLRILEILRNEARSDWRPDLLEQIDASRLEEPLRFAQEAMVDVERLTDPQVAAQVQSVAKQLRAARLSSELTELTILANDTDDDGRPQMVARIAEIARNLAALRKHEPGSARGPAALGTRPPLVPARFRAIDLAPRAERPAVAPAQPVATMASVAEEPEEEEELYLAGEEQILEPPEEPPFEPPPDYDD